MTVRAGHWNIPSSQPRNTPGGLGKETEFRSPESSRCFKTKGLAMSRKWERGLRARRLGLLAASALFLSFLVPATASAATESASQAATTCFGGSVSISLPPNGYSGTYTTSSRCNDINLRIDSGGGQWVAVCWAAHNSCQDHWTWVTQGAGYIVVATDVLDGTTFYYTTTGGGGTRGGRTAQ
jgi:hypothetical protein